MLANYFKEIIILTAEQRISDEKFACSIKQVLPFHICEIVPCASWVAAWEISCRLILCLRFVGSSCNANKHCQSSKKVLILSFRKKKTSWDITVPFIFNRS